jgi:predicted exporter
VLTFGVLSLCRTPLLRQIGTTVVIGSLFALALAFLFAGERPRDLPEPT